MPGQANAELALGQLEAVTKTPGYYTYGNLRLSPLWDPLRGDPRFEKIVNSLARKIGGLLLHQTTAVVVAAVSRRRRGIASLAPKEAARSK